MSPALLARFAPLGTWIEGRWVPLRALETMIERNQPKADAGQLEPRGFGWSAAK